MQEMNRRRNCSRTSVNQEPSVQCQQKQQRIRCCGRVISKDELNNQPIEDFQGRCTQNRQGQGRRNNQENRVQNEQSQGRGRRNGQGRGSQNGLGKGRQNGQGKGQYRQNT